MKMFQIFIESHEGVSVHDPLFHRVPKVDRICSSRDCEDLDPPLEVYLPRMFMAKFKRISSRILES